MKIQNTLKVWAEDLETLKRNSMWSRDCFGVFSSEDCLSFPFFMSFFLIPVKLTTEYCSLGYISRLIFRSFCVPFGVHAHTRAHFLGSYNFSSTQFWCWFEKAIPTVSVNNEPPSMALSDLYACNHESYWIKNGNNTRDAVTFLYVINANE